MKRLNVLLAAVLLGCAALSPAASASQETIGLSMAAKPTAGPLYKEVHRPISASLTVTVTAPPASPKVTPIKVANVTFPRDMDFFPDSGRTPACPDSKLNEQTNLAAGIQAIVALCPDSVVGTGDAKVKLAKLNQPVADVTDPQLVVFNAGRNQSGRPRILIYGYSKTVNTGLLMRGTLARDGQLRIEIGVLPADSAISEFTLGIPGEPLGDVKGLDPEYLRAKCSTGTWRATGAFVLGERADPSGTPIGPDTLLSSNPFEMSCKGRAGAPRIAIARVSGPDRVRPNRKTTFRVKIRNSGFATARGVKLKVRGALSGTRLVGSVPPQGSRTVKVRATSASRRGKRKATFLVTANNSVRKESVRKIRVG